MNAHTSNIEGAEVPERTTRSAPPLSSSGCVPVWVPNPDDPQGIDGSWQIVDPRSGDIHPRLAAQARAIADLWSTGNDAA